MRIFSYSRIMLILGLIFLYIAVRLLHKQTITNLTTSRSKIDWKRVFLAFLLWGFISTSMTLIDISMSPEDYVYNFEFDHSVNQNTIISNPLDLF